MRQFRFRLLPTLVCLPVFVFLVSLGNWQLDRLHWKKNLIAAVEARLSQPVRNIPAASDWQGLSASDHVYRPVFLEGVFDHRGEQFWFTHHEKHGPGYQVITPLVRAGRQVVMVNRGFVPVAQKDPGTRFEGQGKDTIRLEGLMVWPGRRSMFDPPDEPENSLWFVKDPAAMAENAGYGGGNWQVAPFFVDSRAPQAGTLPVKGPIGGQTRVDLPNRHLEYVVTWYGLALALVIIYVQWLRQHNPGETSKGGTDR